MITTNTRDVEALKLPIPRTITIDAPSAGGSGVPLGQRPIRTLSRHEIVDPHILLPVEFRTLSLQVEYRSSFGDNSAGRSRQDAVKGKFFLLIALLLDPDTTQKSYRSIGTLSPFRRLSRGFQSLRRQA